MNVIKLLALINLRVVLGTIHMLVFKRKQIAVKITKYGITIHLGALNWPGALGNMEINASQEI